ncbi:MAG: hypothetical protein ACKO0W_10100 [Planctomycetota bacterium]
MSLAHPMREPDAARCAALARAHFERGGTRALWGREIAAWRESMRAALDLPADRPVVMTGHQAGIWHAGIAEKFLLGEEVARAIGGVLVHVVVDHDRNDAALVAYPALVDGRLARLALERSPRAAAGTPNALRKPVRTMRPEERHQVPAAIEPALARTEAAIRAEFGRGNLAMQMAHAANRLLEPHARVEHTVAATAIARLPLAAAMRAEFGALRAAYNAAVARERIAPLEATELPFWMLDAATGTRIAFPEYSSEGMLAPRALTLTAIARLALCDLFIHGTGGARYDLAMERWIGDALGEATRDTLAPMAVATATRLAPISEFVPPFDRAATPDALRALEQDPFGDDGRSKRALHAAIVGPRAEKRAAFVAMRRAIERARAERASELDALRARIAANGDALAAHALATDRTWPFPFAR